jgi:hypothetical protein
VRTLDHDLLAHADAVERGGGPDRADAVQHDAQPIRCPRCSVTLERGYVRSAVCVIDSCPEHGTWFDVGEFQRVSRVLARLRHRGLRLKTADGSGWLEVLRSLA